MRQEVDSLAQRLEHGIFIQVDRIDFFFPALLLSFVTTFMRKDEGSFGIGLYFAENGFASS